jgi:hypothetical protein
MSNDNDNFDELFAEIMGDHTPPSAAAVEAAVEAAAEAVTDAVVEQVIAAPIPSEPAKAKYRSIPADEKVVLEGAPCDTTVYPLGYCKFHWRNPKFQNACSLYEDQVDEFAAFFQSPEYPAWRAAAKAAGLRKRGVKREGN